jgi:hypothetical protein
MVASLYLGFDNVNLLDQEPKRMSASMRAPSTATAPPPAYTPP